jgi:hypothetical protein
LASEQNEGMEPSFDIRGNLKPYERIKLNIQDFKSTFIDSFEEDSTRYGLFEKYLSYTENFREKVTSNLTQWINGSFVTNKKNPNDIDFVNLVDFSTVEEKDDVIRKEFIRNDALKKYGLDAYLLTVYPEDHKFGIYTKSDILHWNDWFTKSRKDKRGKRYPKGYVELEFREKD